MKYIGVFFGIIGRLIAFIAILGFVFGIVALSGNYEFLWLLWLLPTVEFIPTYNFTTYSDDDADTEEN